MTVYSLYIYDRHCACIYYQDWHRAQRPKPAVAGNLLSGVARAVSPQPSAVAEHVEFTSPRNTLSYSSGIVIAVGEPSPYVNPTPPPLPAKSPSQPPAPPMSTLSFDEEAKLVYGVIFSLKGMVQKLSGRDESFVNYRTSIYKLHVFETITGYKFVVLTDPGADSMRYALRQIYTGPFLEFAVKNPLIEMDSKERGVDNDYFRQAVDRLMRSLPVFSRGP